MSDDNRVSSRLPAARRRRQLLEVARRVFAERGFHDASMNDIAIAAGVTKPVLYQHFASKRELFSELLRDVGRDLQDTITKAVTAAETPRQMVELGFSAYFAFVDEHRNAFQLFYGGSMARDTEFAEVVSQTESAVAGLVAGLIEIDGLSDSQRQVLGHGIVGMIEGASIHWLRSSSDADPETLAQQLADLAWRGLRGVEP
ncbi:MAG TPA: TetR/AcrR family transcriptional regulator [Acidimicrobiales bacterium]|nr:TetR/AcrR family transcriptional regulator [Acidimicrobiales bacterium]